MAQDSAAEDRLRREEERLRQQSEAAKPAPDTLRPPSRAEADKPLPQETPCFTLQQLDVLGADAASFLWLRPHAEKFKGQCVGVEGLRRIVSALDTALIERGYVTSRTSLPQQNLRDGKLTIRLHSGRISAIRMMQLREGKAEPDTAWGRWENAFPVSAGDFLNIRPIEQGIEQMQRLPSQQVEMRIEPGDEPDTSVLPIDRRSGGLAQRLRGGVTVDNSGGESLGRTQLAANLALDNPLGLNDILLLSANGNLENHKSDRHSRSGSVHYSIPYGYHLFSISRSHSRFAQRVQGTTVQFLSTGSSDNAELRWDYLFHRNSSAKYSLYFATQARRARSYLDDVEILVQRRRTAQAEIGITARKLFTEATLDAELSYRKGVPWLGAQADYAAADDGGLTLRPGITSLSLSYQQPVSVFGKRLRFASRARLQHTDDRSLVADQFAIGNRYSVRGFDGDAVLLAESGAYLRNELTLPLPRFLQVSSALYLALDAGQVWGHSASALVGDSLLGAALGYRGQWQQLQWDIAIGVPLSKPAGYQTQSVTPYASATYAF